MLLEKTVAALKEERRCAVLVGDLQTSRDAERLAGDSLEVIQINTGRGCHLSAAQVMEGIASLNLDRIDYLFIEAGGFSERHPVGWQSPWLVMKRKPVNP